MWSCATAAVGSVAARSHAASTGASGSTPRASMASSSSAAAQKSRILASLEDSRSFRIFPRFASWSAKNVFQAGYSAGTGLEAIQPPFAYLKKLAPGATLASRFFGSTPDTLAATSTQPVHTGPSLLHGLLQHSHDKRFLPGLAGSKSIIARRAARRAAATACARSDDVRRRGGDGCDDDADATAATTSRLLQARARREA
mmetsp:Transcript_17257/g.53061  ORF Transcript_17257/g.53061 Transcript_17257/m.53061 type:complete len:200 (+) Transcript_17257:1632-2231(+)